MKVEAKKLQLSAQTNMAIFALIAIGIVSFALGLMSNPDRTWHAYLLYHSMFMGMAIGAFFILIIHYLSSAGWIVGVRRVLEAMTSYLIPASILTLMILFGLNHIYSWTNHEMMASERVLSHKIGYFSPWFFGLRIAMFFAVVVGFSGKMICNSTKQDEEGGLELSTAQKKLSAMSILLFAPMFTILAVDLYKSLDPKWFSTMWGVYIFIGFVQSAVAAWILIVSRLKKHGYLDVATDEHNHDMGKYLFGFTIFWAYIAVSQYLLIWYANLPEETTFYMARQNPGWVCMSILLPIFRFLLPFALLLPRAAKRCTGHLQRVALIVLVGEFIDLNWIIMPSLTPDGFHLAVTDIGLFLGFLGIFAFWVRRFLSKHNTVPVKDPYLHETAHHHVM